MSGLPDSAQLDAIAARIDAHADATRGDAARLSGVLAGSQWRGSAAEAFRAQANSVISMLLVSAGRLDVAADALRRHAATVAQISAEARAAAAHTARSHPAQPARDLLRGVA